MSDAVQWSERLSVSRSTSEDRLRRGIAHLAARYRLAAPAGDQLELLARLLAIEKDAPTTVHDPQRIYDDHLADSLVALELPSVRAAVTIADLGAGAGLPGLCLAIARPGSRVWLLESNARKCRFIERAIERTGVENARVVNERAESWIDGLERCELVTVRALAALPVVAEYAAPLLVMGGRLVAWRGRRNAEDEAAGRRAAGELGLQIGDPVPVAPYPGALHRHLQPMLKVAATPSRFPRRPGVARKRPLGSRPSPRAV